MRTGELSTMAFLVEDDVSLRGRLHFQKRLCYGITLMWWMDDFLMN